MDREQAPWFSLPFTAVPSIKYGERLRQVGHMDEEDVRAGPPKSVDSTNQGSRLDEGRQRNSSLFIGKETEVIHWKTWKPKGVSQRR